MVRAEICFSSSWARRHAGRAFVVGAALWLGCVTLTGLAACSDDGDGGTASNTPDAGDGGIDATENNVPNNVPNNEGNNEGNNAPNNEGNNTADVGVDVGEDEPDEPPEPEVCDGLDNDGDGAVDQEDDDFQGELCLFQAGFCDGATARCEGVNGSPNCRLPEYRAVAPRFTYRDLCDGVDNNCNDLIDEECVVCPEGMALVDGNWCIDRFEASADPDNPDGARSVAGAQPLVDVSYREAQARCEASGKTLCEGNTWRVACRNPFDQDFPYGDERDEAACNQTAENGVELTGARASCVAPWFSQDGDEAGQVFDLLGNVAEWVDDFPSGRVTRGGSFRNPIGCGVESVGGSSGGSPSIGFRCCVRPAPPVDP